LECVQIALRPLSIHLVVSFHFDQLNHPEVARIDFTFQATRTILLQLAPQAVHHMDLHLDHYFAHINLQAEESHYQFQY
jgi:hypothetical protein